MHKELFKGITAADMAAVDSIDWGGAKLIPIDPKKPDLTPWQRARLGKITGSCFGKIKYGRGGKGWSETTETYLSELVWEHATGQPASKFTGNAATQWGNEHEDDAIEEYTRRTGYPVKRGKFYKMKGHKLIGCTPDGVGEKGLEVKCPYGPKAHFRTIIEDQIPDEYIDQVRGHCLVTSREYCDFVTYDPRIPLPHLQLHCIEYEAEPHEIEELHDRLSQFEEYLFETLHRLNIEPL